MTDWIDKGQAAPDFTLASDSGEEVTLSRLSGRWVVLYFYPKDDTPGCTREACGFRDRSAALAERGAVVLGVSPDDVDSHRRFRDQYSLDFPLLADPDHRVAEAFGAWRERTLYGRRFTGIQRSTFLIDPQGVVRRVWRRVSPQGHADQVLGELGRQATG